MKDEKKLKKRIIIQTIEEYQQENNLQIPKLDISEFPELFIVKLNKNKRDDVPSSVPVLKGTAGINLYTALLVANAELTLK